MNSYCKTLLILLMCLLPTALKAACEADGFQLQILGSGGPGFSQGRASAGYLLWLNGTNRILVDAGSGTKDQFHQANGNLGDLSLLALSHLHPDHSAELPALLWPGGGRFVLAGPTGGGVFPSLGAFVDRLFGAQGAFTVLADRTEFQLITVDTGNFAVQSVWEDKDLRVSARRVPHGDVPTLAYRVDRGDSSIVFSSDQNGSDPAFVEFIRDVDYLVIHLAVAEDVAGVGAQLHARPSVWGQMASAGNVGAVIVSHISADSDVALAENLRMLRSNYAGKIIVGQDLLCVGLD